MTQRCPHSTRPQHLLATQAHFISSTSASPSTTQNPSVSSPGLLTSCLAPPHACKPRCSNASKLNAGLVDRGVVSLLRGGHIVRSLLIMVSMPAACAPERAVNRKAPLQATKFCTLPGARSPSSFCPSLFSERNTPETLSQSPQGHLHSSRKARGHILTCSFRRRIEAKPLRTCSRLGER